MAVEKYKAGVIEHEPHHQGSFVSRVSTESNFDFERFHMPNSVFKLFTDQDCQVQANHCFNMNDLVPIVDKIIHDDIIPQFYPFGVSWP